MSSVRIYEPAADAPQGVPVDTVDIAGGVKRQRIALGSDEIGLALDATLVTLIAAVNTDRRTLTERMSAKAPAPEYRLWFDTADTGHIYTAEAPDAAVAGDATFRGIRVTLNASGNPVGKVEVREGFAWDARTVGVWT